MSNNDYPQAFGAGPFGGAANQGMPPTIAQPKGRRGRKSKRNEPGRKSSSNLGGLFLLFAAAVGILAIVVTAAPGKKTYVVRAKDAIAPLVALDKTQFDVAAVDPAAAEPDALQASSAKEAQSALDGAIAGKWFLYPVGAGQQVRASMLADSGVLATPLKEDERLVSITVDVANAVAGSVHAGNRVDIYVSDQDGFTGVLGQGVEIVAVSIQPEQFASAAKQQFDEPGKTLSDFIPDQPVGGTYVLRINAGEVAKYVAADTAGKITMSLHGKDAASFAPAPVDLRQAICGINSNEPACARADQ
jgi:Flp pilus assembly protein CpaB